MQKTFSMEPSAVVAFTPRNQRNQPKDQRKIQQMIDKVEQINTNFSTTQNLQNPFIQNVKKRSKSKTPNQESINELYIGLNPWQAAIKKQGIQQQQLITTGYDNFKNLKSHSKPRLQNHEKALPKVDLGQTERTNKLELPKQDSNHFIQNSPQNEENKGDQTPKTNPQSAKQQLSDGGFEMQNDHEKFKHILNKSDDFLLHTESTHQQQLFLNDISEEKDDALSQLQNEKSKESRQVDEALQKFQHIINQNQPWIDPDFPPKQESLYANNETEGKFGTVEWKRIHEINKRAVLFDSKSEHGDIQQGELEDCYFLSVIISMAQFQGEVTKLFQEKNLNRKGCQLIYFQINGHKTPILVDDYLPCRDGKPIFAHQKSNSFWVCLVEKAWAKLHGSYSAISNGQPAFAFSQVAGYPSRVFIHNEVADLDRDLFWNQLQAAHQKSFFMIAGSNDQDGGYGLIPKHCYSILAFHEFFYKRNLTKKTKLVKLRNPWGHAEWNGPWSDSSSVWTKEARKELNHELADDGLFFMTFSDYIKHFKSTTICMENQKERAIISDCTLNLSDDGPPHAFLKFRLTKRVDSTKLQFTISVQQQGNRMTYHNPDHLKRFLPSYFNLILMREDGTYVDSNFGSDQLQSLFVRPDVDIGPGNYICMIDPVWNQSTNLDPMHRVVLVGIHCQEKVKLESIDFQKGLNHLAETLKHFAINRSPAELKDYYLDENSAYCGQVWRVRDINSMDFAFIYTHNDSKQRLTERIDLKLQGYEVIYPTTLHKFVIDIPPNSDDIIILKRTAINKIYAMNYLTFPILRNDQELLAAAQEKGVITLFGNNQKAYLQTLNAPDATVLLVVNSTEQRLSIDFTMRLTNLKLIGHPDGAEKLHLNIEAGQQKVEILRPINLGKKTDITVKTKYEFL